MSGLKGFLRTLSPILERTPDALYERQRSLVQVGLLGTNEGRGPGSGVRLTARSLSLLLISVLATDNVSDIAKVRRVAVAAAHDGNCPLTGAYTFTDAVERVIADPLMAQRVSKISVLRNISNGEIQFTGKRASRIQRSEFVQVEESAELSIMIEATLLGKRLQELSAAFRGIA